MIPFTKQAIVGQEYAYMLRSCRYSTDFITKCERLLENIFQNEVLLTNSGTSALEMAALLLNINSEDEVIVPAFTHPASASAFARLGARIVFADVTEDTLNIDPLAVRDLVTSRTKAIVPVHYNGVACNIAALQSFNIDIVEDNAHGLFQYSKDYEGYLGTFGRLSATSFHSTKNYQCQEGGALFLNYNYDMFRAKCIRDNGTDRHLLGLVPAYTWVETGSRYMPAEMLAAYFYAQLKMREVIANRRKKAWDYYYDNLSFLGLPVRKPSSHHIFYFLAKNKIDRDAILKKLTDAGITAVFHYQPLNKSKMGLTFGEQHCPVAESVADRIIRLPLYYDLTQAQQDYIIEVLWKVQS